MEAHEFPFPYLLEELRRFLVETLDPATRCSLSLTCRAYYSDFFDPKISGYGFLEECARYGHTNLFSFGLFELKCPQNDTLTKAALVEKPHLLTLDLIRLVVEKKKTPIPKYSGPNLPLDSFNEPLCAFLKACPPERYPEVLQHPFWQRLYFHPTVGDLLISFVKEGLITFIKFLFESDPRIRDSISFWRAHLGAIAPPIHLSCPAFLQTPNVRDACWLRSQYPETLSLGVDSNDPKWVHQTLEIAMKYLLKIPFPIKFLEAAATNYSQKLSSNETPLRVTCDIQSLFNYACGLEVGTLITMRDHMDLLGLTEDEFRAHISEGMMKVSWWWQPYKDKSIPIYNLHQLRNLISEPARLSVMEQFGWLLLSSGPQSLQGRREKLRGTVRLIMEEFTESERDKFLRIENGTSKALEAFLLEWGDFETFNYLWKLGVKFNPNALVDFFFANTQHKKEPLKSHGAMEIIKFLFAQGFPLDTATLKTGQANYYRNITNVFFTLRPHETLSYYVENIYGPKYLDSLIYTNLIDLVLGDSLPVRINFGHFFEALRVSLKYCPSGSGIENKCYALRDRIKVGRFKEKKVFLERFIALFQEFGLNLLADPPQT